MRNVRSRLQMFREVWSRLGRALAIEIRSGTVAKRRGAAVSGESCTCVEMWRGLRRGFSLRKLQVHWDKVSLADLFRLITGNDSGVRGEFGLDGTASVGAPDANANALTNAAANATPGRMEMKWRHGRRKFTAGI